MKNQLSLVLILASITVALAQKDDSSHGVYGNKYINAAWGKLDKNKDDTFSKEEATTDRTWNRFKYLDANADNEISAAEFRKLEIPYLNTGGERKLNLLYKQTKEENLYLDIYYPKNRTKGQKSPVVVYTHGGGWAAGSRHGAANASFKTVHTELLNNGFCVVSVSYRLWNKKRKTSMRDCVIDAKDALRYLSKNHNELDVDPNRFFSFGDSAGGQIAQLLLLSSPETLLGDAALADYSYTMVAGVSWYGPSDFENMSLFNYDDRPNFTDRFEPRILKPDTDPKDKLALYREMSPVNYLQKKSAPLLMIQGDSDTTIPVKHAYFMAEKASEIGAPVTTLLIKNAGHNWRRVENDIDPTRASIIQSTIDYFVSHL